MGRRPGVEDAKGQLDLAGSMEARAVGGQLGLCTVMLGLLAMVLGLRQYFSVPALG